MYGSASSRVMVFVCQAVILVSACAADVGDKKETGNEKRYPSPKAVFEVYREARAKRDYRKCFSCLTPEAQNEAAFESFFGCAMRKWGDVAAIVKKYVDTARIGDAYKKKYKEKHGIDIAKAVERYKNDPTLTPPPRDRQLLRDVVAAHIKDKAGFYEAVGKYSDKRAADRHEANPVCPIGDLEQLVVQGDTATGKAKVTILPRGGESPRRPGQPARAYEKPLKFRRINGGWLLDSQ